jgi:hypothetical protein
VKLTKVAEMKLVEACRVFIYPNGPIVQFGTIWNYIQEEIGSTSIRLSKIVAF